MKIGKYRVIDLINPIKWYRAAIWKYREYTNVLPIPTDELQFRSELVVYRGTMCQECRDKGVCKSCGCPFGAKAVNPNEECADGKWGKTNKDDWNNIKGVLNFDLGIVKNNNEDKGK